VTDTVATGGRVRSFSRILRLTQPNRADVIAFVLLIGIAALLVRGAEGVAEPLSRLRVEPVTLDPRYLPYYALRTVIRMFAALAASLVFTLVVATLAARSRRAGQIIVPMLDILQSVPILGFLTFTVTAFMGLFPGQILGVELAAVFAIFTSQAWNMAFSFYQSLRSVPSDLDEVTRGFALSPVRRFLRLDLPFATPSLVWNAMMSMSGGWFFVVASEAITVGNTTVTLPGVGSWLALAIARKDFTAIGLAVVVPAGVPTMSMSVFDGNGPGTREVEVQDPMVDLRRDLSRGQDIPLLWVTTAGPRPTYLRLSVLTRFNGSSWTPGDREIPDTQTATGAIPPLDGVSTALGRKEHKYDVRIGPDFESTWLPTTAQVSRIAAGTDWRYDVNTRDFIGARDEVTTADRTYDFTGVQLDYDAQAMNDAVSGAGSVAGTFTDVPSSLNSEIERLARSETAAGETRFQKAQLLQEFFRTSGGFRYDVAQAELAGSGGADLRAFLLEDRVGYCEQFAASMAIMARVIGIPSRVAVGFLAPDRSTNGAWEFSSHDLHAWPELYFPGSGWVRFEPTPQARATEPPAYTEAEFEAVTESPTPSASRSTELLPERGEEPSADTGAADTDTTSIPWVPIIASVVGLALLALLLLTPRLVRGARRRRRLDGDIEDLWVELRDVAHDLGHAWPVGRSPRRVGDWLGRLLAAPAAGHDRPDRPRRGRDQAPEAAYALDRLVVALERSRYARDPESFTAAQHARDADLVEQALVAGVTPREVRRASWWPASVVGRRTTWRPRGRAGTAQTETPDHETSRTVDELVG